MEAENLIFLGKTLIAIEGAVKGSEEIYFTFSDGTKYKMFHNQSCCEVVEIEDVCGEVNDLLNEPLLLAEVVTNENETPEGYPSMDGRYSYTWTFYKLATNKGYMTIRWLGESNGYYGEEVKIREEPHD
jgi:hypothetical protein